MEIQKIETTLTLKKPAIFGMCILELSKEITQEFCYDDIKNKYENKWRLLFTNTDSLLYEIENVYDRFSKNKLMFDFSNYSAKSTYYDYSNALVVGKMKNEIGGVAVKEFVELKSKICPILVNNFSEKSWTFR